MRMGMRMRMMMRMMRMVMMLLMIDDANMRMMMEDDNADNFGGK